ncbi:hypothetical protein KAH81_02290, partial [bacterium]|nr:hypothetical protein [bacterium]
MKNLRLLIVLLFVAFAFGQQYNNIFNPPQLTDLTGGGAADLDGVRTNGLSIGSLIFVFDGSQTRTYCLTAGTDAEDSPLVIRPDDFDAGTNAKVWKLRLSSDPVETDFIDEVIGTQDTMIAHWDSVRDIPADIADGDDFEANTIDTNIAHWGDIRDIPADIADGDDFEPNTIDTNIAHWGDIRDIPADIADGDQFDTTIAHWG